MRGDRHKRNRTPRDFYGTLYFRVMNSINKKDRIVVTGGAGFLGSAVMDRLASLKYENTIAIRSRDYDLTTEEGADQLFGKLEPSVVIHLAAEVGGIGANMATPGRYFYSNLAMGMHLIEASRRYGVKKFIQTGTIVSYPKSAPMPLREEDLWDGYPEEIMAPYGVAKKALLVMCQTYRKQYGLNAVYLLPVNLYGPRDHFEPHRSNVIPALIRRCLEAIDHGDTELTVWGTGKATREFLYVDDCAAAMVSAMEQYNGAEPINLGSGVETSIRGLVELIARLSGFKGSVLWDSTKPDGNLRRQLNVERAEREFEFRASTALEDGLRRTIDWYLKDRLLMK